MNKKLNDFNTKFKGSTAPKPSMFYTGTNMIGIAQIPKSNAQPVFSAEEAKGTVKVKWVLVILLIASGILLLRIGQLHQHNKTIAPLVEGLGLVVGNGHNNLWLRARQTLA